jgi:hypothetical protein
MLPYEGTNVLIAQGSACYGSASRYPGTLASTLARWNDTEGSAAVQPRESPQDSPPRTNNMSFLGRWFLVEDAKGGRNS